MTLAAGILGRTGDFNRFHSLAGIRSFTGLVPKIDQSGIEDHNKGPTKHGDPGLRHALFLAAEHARKIDPTLAARYHRLYVEQGKHHNSAICADRYRIDPATRAKRRNATTAKKLKRAGRDKKESQSAPVTDPPHHEHTKAA